MVNFFSPRELAFATWLVLLLCFSLGNKESRHSLRDLLRIAFSPKLSIPFCLLLTYAVALILLFSKLPFWKDSFIKDVIFWVLFAGVPICFDAVSKANGTRYFKNVVFDNFKLTVIVEFIVSTFTFNFVVEFFLLPTLFFITVIDAFAGMNNQYKSVKKLTSSVLAMIGFVVIGLSLKKAIFEYMKFGITDLLISFCLPIVLSVLYVPLSYIFALIAKYEIVFIRMDCKQPKDKRILRRRKWSVIRECKLSYGKICKFEKELINQMFVAMTDEEFRSLFYKLREPTTLKK